MRIVADQVTLGHVLDQLRCYVSREGGVVGLAVTDDAAIGGQLDEDEILAADARRRIADYPGLDVGDLHFWSSRTSSAPFHPVMTEAALVLPVMLAGNIEASMTRRPSSPCTFRRGSTTAAPASGPMRQVETG